MFRRVREAARRGRTQAKSLLAMAGRGAVTVGVYAIRAVKKLWQGIDAVLTATARGVTWTWMSVVEVASLTLSPFVWILGNILWWVFRGLENGVNKVRKTQYTWAHNRFQAFTLLNAVAMSNTDLYPLVALVGWLLSPFADQNWWRSTAHGFKVRTVSAADWDYVERIKKDLGFDRTMGEPEESAWEAATNHVDTRMTEADAAAYYQQMLAEGWSLVYPEAGKEEGLFDYMVDRIRQDPETDEQDVSEFLLSVQEDAWGRHWAMMPDNISTQRPTKAETEEAPVAPPAEPEEHLHARHAADDLDAHGLQNFDVTEVPDDFNQLHDPKERSYWYGVQFVTESKRKIKNFLTSEEQQNRARALVAKDTRNPQSGFLQAYALKGFEEELDRAKEAASHQV